MSDESIADVPNEGDIVEDTAFEKAEDNVEETTSESQPEKKQADKPPQEGDNTPDEDKLPFHKHPRWKKLNETNKELQTRLAEFEQKFKEVEPVLKQRQDIALPDWWKNTYGDTVESKDAFRKYEDATKAERDRIKSEVLSEIQSQQQESSKADSQAQEYIEGEIEAMQDEGLKFETNELMKFVLDFQDQYGSGSLLDNEGNYDLRKALKLMQNFNPQKESTSTETKKKLASETISSKGKSAPVSDLPKLSRYALRRGNWRDAEK